MIPASRVATSPRAEPTYEDLADLATNRGVRMVAGWITAGALAVALAWRCRRG